MLTLSEPSLLVKNGTNPTGLRVLLDRSVMCFQYRRAHAARSYVYGCAWSIFTGASRLRVKC